jgi:hypothetical protein
MATQVTDVVARTMLDSLDATFNGGKIQIRTGAAPGVGQSPAGTLLIDEDLPADALAPASGRSKAKNGTWQAVGLAVGQAGHFRIIAAGDTGGANQNEPRIEGTVTATGGGGELTLDNINIAVDQTVTVTSFSLAVPASA